MNLLLGYLAGLSTSVAWSFTSTFFTIAGRMVGSPIVNRMRLLLALGMVLVTHWLLEGQPLPLDAEPYRWGWLAISGFLGFIFGDALLFQAFVMIGPRLSMLLMALAPVISTIMAWALLGETLSGGQLLGVALAVGGVMFVVSDRRNGKTQGGQPAASDQPAALTAENPGRYYVIGLLFGLGGALGQASGMFASRMGLEGEFSAISGNTIRLFTAAVIIWIFTLAQGTARRSIEKLREHPKAFGALTIGAVAGPFIGVSLSLLAVQNAPLGIASTLTSLTPIFLLPVGHFFFNDKITLRAVAGTVLAVAGVAAIFLAQNPAP